MIRTKEDLRYYIQEDLRVFGKSASLSLKQRLLNLLFPDNNLSYLKYLRYLEYHSNNKGFYHYLMMFYYAHKRSKYQRITGIELYANSAGPGLHLPHGKVVVSGGARLGKMCKINSDVTIGESGRCDCHVNAKIGDRVYIGTGVRIIGGVTIADGVVIGANAVVISDITEPNTTWIGVPARKISERGSESYLFM